MDRLQHAVFLAVDAGDALPGRRAPGEEDDTASAHAGHGVQGFLGEALPAFIRVAVGLVGADGQAGVEHEHAALGPRRQQPAFVRRRLEGRVVVLDALVHVGQRRGRGRRRPHGEREPVRLVVVVVRVLADDDGFDFVEGGVSGPVCTYAYEQSSQIG